MVVGGTKGIGSGIAVSLAERGCSTIDIVGRDRIAGEKVAQAIRDIQKNFMFYRRDRPEKSLLIYRREEQDFQLQSI